MESLFNSIKEDPDLFELNCYNYNLKSEKINQINSLIFIEILFFLLNYVSEAN